MGWVGPAPLQWPQLIHQKAETDLNIKSCFSRQWQRIQSIQDPCLGRTNTSVGDPGGEVCLGLLPPGWAGHGIQGTSKDESAPGLLTGPSTPTPTPQNNPGCPSWFPLPSG